MPASTKTSQAMTARGSKPRRHGRSPQPLLPLSISLLNQKLTAQARRLVADHGLLNMPQWRILRVMNLSDDNSSKAVRSISAMDKGQFSRSLNELVDLRLVKLQPSPVDQRQVMIVMTKKGKQVYREIAPRLDARNQLLIGALNSAEQSIFLKTLEKLSKVADTNPSASS